ncbi:N-acetylmuramoyl-L-alanine amidase [Kineococcus sp. SYSU DK003]|uniref:N-acetylmuramoyl-L-alanine amidase n=1 Tax=Kineococcus sp. SYSU DK003 TaxID=3383124 RepID=UPI003D7C730A
MASPIPGPRRPSTRPLSRRAALTGIGGALAVPAVPAVPAPALAAPTIPTPTTTGGVQTFGLADRVRALLSGALSGATTTTVSVPVDGGAMVGVTFPRGTRAASVAVRVTRAGAAPGPWLDLALSDNAPDPGRADPDVVASDPVWTGDLGPGATVEVRLPLADAAHAQLAVVDPGPAPSATPSRTAVTLAAASVSGSTADSLRPRIRSRAEWGADESLRRGAAEYSPAIAAAVVHHTADGGSYSQADVPAVIRGMYRYHTQTLGWSDLGYNFVVDRFGGIWEGRAGGVTRAVLGAHAGGFNSGTFGVSMMGDFTSRAPSEACLQAVAAVIAWKFRLHDVPAEGTVQLTSSGGGTARYAAGAVATIDRISGHRDVGYTACPGDVGYTRMGDVRARVRTLLAGHPRGSAVDRKYDEVDGPSLLGAPTSAEGNALRGGRFRHYEKGSIYHHPDLGTHVVRGSHTGKYASVGWEWSPLGFPTADTTNLPGDVGSFTHFEHGSIYRRAGQEPRIVRGAIRTAWAAQGWENSALGFPVSDEYDVRGGRASDFEGGQLRWNSSTGRVQEAS